MTDWQVCYLRPVCRPVCPPVCHPVCQLICCRVWNPVWRVCRHRVTLLLKTFSQTGFWQMDCGYCRQTSSQAAFPLACYGAWALGRLCPVWICRDGACQKQIYFLRIYVARFCSVWPDYRLAFQLVSHLVCQLVCSVASDRCARYHPVFCWCHRRQRAPFLVWRFPMATTHHHGLCSGPICALRYGLHS